MRTRVDDQLQYGGIGLIGSASNEVLSITPELLNAVEFAMKLGAPSDVDPALLSENPHPRHLEVEHSCSILRTISRIMNSLQS